MSIVGKLEPFFETGTEGVVWSVIDDLHPGSYDGLHCLRDGDRLKVYSEDGSKVEWEGVVKLEYKRRYRPYPMNPQYGQQEIRGMWVRGFQEGMEPDTWAGWFFGKRKAELERPS